MGATSIQALDIRTHVPEAVNRLFDLFQANEFELYAVGGCIRNLLLQREPKDWDFATSALVEEMIQMCEKIDLSYIPTGIAYGTLTLIIEGQFFEVTTFRTEGRYSGRAPAELSFTRNLQEDLKRRDFTMNAIAWNPQMGLVDLFGGIQDIEHKAIRLIGNGNRFEEDPLRVLRAARFAAELDFTIESSTELALLEHNHSLKRISKERITSELNKLLLSEHVFKGLNILKTSGIMEILLPEVEKTTDYDQRSPYHMHDLYTHLSHVVQNTPPILTVRWAALLHDISKPDCATLDETGCAHYYGHNEHGAEVAASILERFTLSKTDQKRIVLLIGEHMTLDDAIGKKGIKRLLNILDTDGLEELIALTIADKFLTRQDQSKAEAKTESKVFESRIQTLINDIKRASEPYEMSQLAITGSDIMSLGFSAGPLIGRIKTACMAQVLEHPEMNERDILIKWVQLQYQSE